MKNIIKLLIFIQIFGCYNKYGVVLGEEKTNVIPSMPHKNYTLDDAPSEANNIPRSIIFIIADGTGIGQYSLSYYANGPFAPARFEHIGLVATHPNPSVLSEKAANRALSFCEAIQEADLLVCAISGGTSALLAAPRKPLSLDEKISINEGLLRSGADIQSVNLVRQQLSWIKGGGLASATKATVETLVFSDIEQKSFFGPFQILPQIKL